jgi:Ca-activated chloride channel family protein
MLFGESQQQQQQQQQEQQDSLDVEQQQGQQGQQPQQQQQQQQQEQVLSSQQEPVQQQHHHHHFQDMLRRFGPQQPVVVAQCEDTEGLEGYEPQGLRHKLVTGFKIVPNRSAAILDRRGEGSKAGVHGADGQEGKRQQQQQEEEEEEVEEGAKLQQQEQLQQQQTCFQPVHNLRQIAMAVLSGQVSVSNEGGAWVWVTCLYRCCYTLY